MSGWALIVNQSTGQTNGVNFTCYMQCMSHKIDYLILNLYCKPLLERNISNTVLTKFSVII